MTNESDLGDAIAAFYADVRAAVWSHDRLVMLMKRMVVCCQTSSGDTLPRNVACGFWTLDTRLRGHLEGRPHWARHLDPAYLARVYEMLMFLADWYFGGDCPMSSPAAMLAEIDRLTPPRTI